MELPCRRFLPAACFYRGFPFFDLAGKELLQILRRAPFRCDHVTSDLSETLLNCRHVECSHSSLVEFLDNRGRRRGGYESGRIDDRFLLRIAIGLTDLAAICGSANGRLGQS